MSNYDFTTRRETMYYDATKESYFTRNIDLAAYLEYELDEYPEIIPTSTPKGMRAQYIFRNQLKIRDLLELYDRGEAQVDPKRYSDIKYKLIQKRNELIPHTNRVASSASAQPRAVYDQ